MSEVDSTLEMCAPAFLPSDQVARSKQPLDLPMVMGLLGDWVQGLHSHLLLPPGPVTGQEHMTVSEKRRAGSECWWSLEGESHGHWTLSALRAARV